MNEGIVPFGVEEWRELTEIGFPGYRVSTIGRVESLHHKRRDLRGKWTPLKPHGKYPMVYLKNAGPRRNIPVHTLILRAFVGPKPSGQEARHLDGKPSNCTLWNLTYGTHLENMYDKFEHGTVLYGTDHPNGKLNDQEVEVIRWLISIRKEFGWTQKQIGKWFGVARSEITNIGSGFIRSHAGGEITIPPPRDKLTDDQVEEIHRTVATEGRHWATYDKLAAALGVKRTTVQSVVYGYRRADKDSRRIDHG